MVNLDENQGKKYGSGILVLGATIGLAIGIILLGIGWIIGTFQSKLIQVYVRICHNSRSDGNRSFHKKKPPVGSLNVFQAKAPSNRIFAHGSPSKIISESRFLWL